jgi:hypothetical protein
MLLLLPAVLCHHCSMLLPPIISAVFYCLLHCRHHCPFFCFPHCGIGYLVPFPGDSHFLSRFLSFTPLINPTHRHFDLMSIPLLPIPFTSNIDMLFTPLRSGCTDVTHATHATHATHPTQSIRAHAHTICSPSAPQPLLPHPTALPQPSVSPLQPAI